MTKNIEIGTRCKLFDRHDCTVVEITIDEPDCKQVIVQYPNGSFEEVDAGWLTIVETGLNIIARKPRPTGGEYVVVKRDVTHHPYVSATANAHSLRYGEWFWGHYFETEAQALEHFNQR